MGPVAQYRNDSATSSKCWANWLSINNIIDCQFAHAFYIFIDCQFAHTFWICCADCQFAQRVYAFSKLCNSAPLHNVQIELIAKMHWTYTLGYMYCYSLSTTPWLWLDAVFIVPSIFCIGRTGQNLVTMNGAQSAVQLREKLYEGFCVSIIRSITDTH